MTRIERSGSGDTAPSMQAVSNYPEGVACMDGQLLDLRSARVSVLDRGFLYGDSVFETFRTYAGVSFALEEHLARLERSAERVRIRLPRSRAELRTDVERAIELGNYSESWIRLMVTRGQGSNLGLDPALANNPLCVILVRPLEEIPESKYEQGISVITYRTQRVADGTDAAGAKLGNYLVSVLAMDAARAASAEEALLVDRDNRLLEGTTSNVFCVQKGRLLTPPVELGILAGITRAHLLSLARAEGLAAEERALSADELFGMDEVFISSSIRELLAVVRVDGRQIGEGTPGPSSRRLLQAFRARARSENRPANRP